MPFTWCVYKTYMLHWILFVTNFLIMVYDYILFYYTMFEYFKVYTMFHQYIALDYIKINQVR